MDQDQSHFELVYGTLLFHKHTSGKYLMVSPLDTKGCVGYELLTKMYMISIQTERGNRQSLKHGGLIILL